MSKKKDKTRSETLAEVHTSPIPSSVVTLSQLHKGASVEGLFDEMNRQRDQLRQGDLSAAEEMLLSQAHVLQSIFNSMVVNMQGTEYINQMEAYGKLALRAQNQCNRTLKTLLEYKNPKRATFIKQQNNLQINQAEKKSEKEIQANELLEENHDARLDTGTAQKAVGRYSEVETLGKVDRAKD